MHNNFDELVKAHQDCCSKSKVVSENGKRFEIDSNEDFTRIKIDDCLIASQQVEKCDFGFIRHSNDEFYFVELKGKEIKKALSQIISTIAHFENHFVGIPKDKRYGFIVSSKNPLAGQATNILKLEFAKKYGKILEIKNIHCKYLPK
nr:hypothetical protein [uncultured Flavobacterium sp.]